MEPRPAAWCTERNRAVGPLEQGVSVSSATKRLSVVMFVALLAALAAACSSSALASQSTPRRQVSDPPSSDPFVASLAYARCLRRHGVPQPDPDRNGDFHLTAAQER